MLLIISLPIIELFAQIIFPTKMVSKTRRKARKSIEAMREMLGEDSDQDENNHNTQNTNANYQPVLTPTSTTRLDAEDEFVRLSHRIDFEIDKGLSASLLQFESRLEAALESIRQTVTNSLSARSQMCTDNESDVDQNCNTASASKVQRITDLSIQEDGLDFSHPQVNMNARDTGQVWIGSQTSLGAGNDDEVYLANPYLSVECQRNDMNLGESQKSNSHNNKVSQNFKLSFLHSCQLLYLAQHQSTVKLQHFPLYSELTSR